jgi:hypothetical protein
MFLINKEKNSIEELSAKSFQELGFKERENLQEWLANNPASLGEDLLIIQKEFDGFNDTRERLDLLALDKQGNLVIIENKLDDTGRDVTWQVLKYASYCSSLSKSQIIDIYQDYLVKEGLDTKAEDRISEFFDSQDIEEISLNKGQTQRVMLVAGNYRKEVTSTLLWLLNYNLRIQCFKVSPYQFGDQLFLNVEQIIPMKEAEEYSIRMAEKTQDDITSQEEMKTRLGIRYEFWSKLLNEMNTRSKLFQNISPSKSNWIGAGSGLSGIGFIFAASQKFSRIELYIDRGDATLNEKIFDFILKEKSKIENLYGAPLQWDKMDDRRACRIRFENENHDVFDKSKWADMISQMVEGMIRFERGIKPILKKVESDLL